MTLVPQGLIDLNRSCYCVPMARGKIDQTILSQSQHPDMSKMLESREHYFASTAVFVSHADLEDMYTQIQAIETVIKTDAYQKAVLARGDSPIFTPQSETSGAFMGYDFHMTPEGPRLIEINSNAGGAFIVSMLEQAIGRPGDIFEESVVQMFIDEWIKAGRTGQPKTIAIVDEMPQEQFHYPDMCLAQDSLRRHGFTVIIADPSGLDFDGTHIHAGGKIIDLVYNRVTDFALTDEKNAALYEALLNDAVVVTPSPRHHAFFADKRNLIWLSDQALLKAWGIPHALRETLSRIPETIAVTSDNADRLWAERKQYFFKPSAGFGSRGTYRGAKITTKVWSNIRRGGYVAQKFIAPSLRAVTRKAGKAELKFDLRVYSYAGQSLLLAARVYQGQTTNLRTDGGGLAPVLTVDNLNMVCG